MTFALTSILGTAPIVKLEDILDKCNLDRVRLGIHRFLGYDGKIILSTVSPDEIIEKLDGKKYAKLINSIKPDAAMVLDYCTYIDHPFALSWYQLFKLVRESEELLRRIDIPIFGIIKGVDQYQVDWCLKKMLNLGVNILVVHYKGLNWKPSIFGRSLFDYLLEKIYDFPYDKRVMLHGRSPLLHIYYRLRHASLSWFLNAERGIVYKEGKKVPLYMNTLYECDCSFCKGRSWRQLIQDIKSMALHNLAQTIAFS